MSKAQHAENARRAEACFRQLLEARDHFLGLNWRVQDVALGLRLLRACDHHVAHWLLRLFPVASPPPSPAEAKKLFLARAALCASERDAGVANNDEALREEESRCLSFAGLVSGCDRPLIELAASKGDPLGMAVAAEWGGAEERIQRLKWAKKAREKGEPQASCRVAHAVWMASGEGSEDGDDGKEMREMREQAEKLYLEAAERGWASAMYYVAQRCRKESDWFERSRWLGASAARGHRPAALELTMAAERTLRMQQEEKKSKKRRKSRMDRGEKRREDVSGAMAVFAVGEALYGHVYEERGLVFSLACDGEYLRHAAQAAFFFSLCAGAARRAIECWLLVGRRQASLNRDVRGMIARLVWKGRAAWADKTAEDERVENREDSGGKRRAKKK